LGSSNLLVDEHGQDKDGDEEDNDEDDNDTGLTLGPVLALHELVNSVLAASDEGHIDGGHCECGGESDEVISYEVSDATDARNEMKIAAPR
jgi:hypothetical protein